jgi:hypothetical protein
MKMESYIPKAGSLNAQAANLFNITLLPPDSPPRSFMGDMYPRTWDNTRERCLYVGNGQGGPGGERDFKGSVIEGHVTDYIVDGLFGTTYKYAKLKGECAKA